MRFRKLIFHICLGAAIAVVFGSPANVHARTQDTGTGIQGQVADNIAVGIERYTVRKNDTLYTISKRFNTSVNALQSLNSLADARLVYEGDTVLVPRLDRAKVKTYVIEPGDSLFEIARRFETSVEALLSLNGIGDRNHILSGQTILLPQPARRSSRPGFGYGITLFPDSENTFELARRVEQLGVNWAKIEVSWADTEPAESRFEFDALDALIEALVERDIQVLLNVYAAPDWSRKSFTARLNSMLHANSGPPEDLEVFGRFMRAVAERYTGLVDAYEIWKSPNLLKYWTVPVYERPPTVDKDGEYGLPDKINIGASYYVDLLKVAFEAIKSVDNDALVITAGLAPVGFTDNYNAVETASFLQGMLREGATEYSDAIGALFGASAVPPRLFCCEQPPGVDTHYESYLQYFREVLYLYHDVLMRNDAEDVPIYLTQAGWGTADGSNLAVPGQGLEWLNYTNLAEQALYLRQAFDLAHGLNTVEGMFLYNLNGCAVGDIEACFFSIMDAEGSDRPAYQTLAAMEKTSLDA